MDLETITEKISQKLSLAPQINARVKFDFGSDGVVFVDATQNPPILNNQDNEADTTLICSLDTFAGFMDGSKDPTMAFMTGKLKVDGSKGLAMKLNSIIGD